MAKMARMGVPEITFVSRKVRGCPSATLPLGRDRLQAVAVGPNLPLS
jgi:hypothetical protein